MAILRDVGLPVAVETLAPESATGLACRFISSEPLSSPVKWLCGILSDVVCKIAWQPAKKAANEVAYGVRHLLSRADWDADYVRDDLTVYVSGKQADRQGVLIVDETGSLKKGTKSAETSGITRPCGADRELPGRRLPYPRRRKGHALLDWELYFPREWAEEAE